MVDHGNLLMLRVDSSGVGVQTVGGVDTAGDGSVGVNLSLHLVSSMNTVVVSDVVVVIVDSCAALKA